MFLLCLILDINIHLLNNKWSSIEIKKQQTSVGVLTMMVDSTIKESDYYSQRLKELWLLLTISSRMNDILWWRPLNNDKEWWRPLKNYQEWTIYFNEVLWTIIKNGQNTLTKASEQRSRMMKASEKWSGTDNILWWNWKNMTSILS